MKLIDADALSYQLAKQACIDGQPRAIKRAKRIVDAQQIVDAVPVIRCKDCKHYMNEDENYPDEYGNCPTVCMYMPNDAEENGYCSRAERKEE